MSKEKIGLFFGTFDPIHNGHLRIAKYITEEKLADKVWLVVTPENPIKVGSKISSFNHRFNMTKIATEKYDNIIPSDLEVNLKKPNYTIDTLEYISRRCWLRKDSCGCNFYLCCNKFRLPSGTNGSN